MTAPSDAADELDRAIRTIQRHAADPRTGLPLEVFYLVSALTPLVNVDLLVQDHAGRSLLAWREDAFYRGWTIPGGIIRFKERAADRIQAVAWSELGARVTHGAEPIATNELMHPTRDVRGHFVSFLYRCALASDLDAARRCTDLAAPRHGELAWHEGCPADLIPQHAIYRRFLAPEAEGDPA